ncbi:MAG: substrate-binding domain-containing protein [Oscillospiraceae bacterium]|nr:substrate-binding domain-containing protein [Oscillospiraceae bacterium]MBR3537388.1 substrate-binding domain-containing protein [Oscillospiraceae bacterium]
MKKALSLLTVLTLAASFTSVHAETAETKSSAEPAAAFTLRADTNLDGKVTETDFLRYKFYLLGDDTMLENNPKTDLNFDEKISISDMIRLRRVLDGDDVLWNPDNLPVMDGSTSAIPLEAGFKSRVLAIPYDEAYDMVEHHKTHESFDMLLSGKNDMIFTVPISESQQREADEKGIHLNMVPVAKEGFVFIVNKNNPVSSLTQDQIKDIYSGVITNWKEVGGNDQPIIAYQRNSDSGSQNLITEFMGSRTLMPKENMTTVLSTMNSLIKAVLDYDNSEQSIGYSVYSYAAQMYENNSGIKFIAVDGIEPSKVTIADGTYPLISSTYAMYTDNAPKRVLDFVKWATSEEGQTCALENGYLPVKDTELPEMLKPYTKCGTGKPKPENYKPEYMRTQLSGSLPGEFRAEISFLKDKKLQGTINSDLKNLFSQIKNDAPSHYKTNISSINYIIINGYMSLIVESKYCYNDKAKGTPEDHILPHYIYTPAKYSTLNYDLKEGKRINRFSDLFYDDTVFVPVLNDALYEYTQGWHLYKKTDFTGLTENFKDFTITSVILPEKNPYYGQSIQLNFDSLYQNYSYYLSDYMVTGEFYDMKDIIDFKDLDCDPDSIYECYRDEWNVIQVKDENNERYTKAEGSAFHTSDEIKEFRKAYEKIIADKNNKASIFNKERRSYNDVTLNVLLRRIDPYAYSYAEMFNNKGDRVWFSDIFGKEFEYLDENIYDIYNISLEDNTVKVYTKDDYKTFTLDIDPDHINMDYINLPFRTEIEKTKN